MGLNKSKTHYTAKELLSLSLSCLPNSKQGILYQAKKQMWNKRKRVDIGGGSFEFELSSLPIDIQAEILLKTPPYQNQVRWKNRLNSK
uniref:Transposase n=1 Tax=Avibacterium paragallinarum TaxID=728 RepID=H6U8G7_AVIPA|nr:transposase [Avibacterium paragallinarum]